MQAGWNTSSRAKEYFKCSQNISAGVDGGPCSQTAYAWPSARHPINTSEYLSAHLSAKSPSNISHNPSVVKSEVLETLDISWKYPISIPKHA